MIIKIRYHLPFDMWRKILSLRYIEPSCMVIHTTNQDRVKHIQLRGLYLSHFDVITYRNLFNLQNLQYFSIVIKFYSRVVAGN